MNNNSRRQNNNFHNQIDQKHKLILTFLNIQTSIIIIVLSRIDHSKNRKRFIRKSFFHHAIRNLFVRKIVFAHYGNPFFIFSHQPERQEKSLTIGVVVVFIQGNDDNDYHYHMVGLFVLVKHPNKMMICIWWLYNVIVVVVRALLWISYDFPHHHLHVRMLSFFPTTNIAWGQLIHHLIISTMG